MKKESDGSGPGFRMTAGFGVLNADEGRAPRLGRRMAGDPDVVYGGGPPCCSRKNSVWRWKHSPDKDGKCIFCDVKV